MLGGGLLMLGPVLAGRRSSVHAICLALAVAVTPLLIGPVAFAFLWNPVQLTLIRTLLGVGFHSGYGVIAVDVTAQTLRYVPLGAWLLTITVLNADPDRVAYANITGMNRWEFVRSELFTPWIVVIAVLGAFVYQDTANDVLLTFLAMRPSPATGTELVGHVLGRVFAMMDIGISPSTAVASIIVISVAAGVLFCGNFLLAMTAMPTLLACAIGAGGRRFARQTTSWRLEAPIIVGTCLLVYGPLTLALLSQPPIFGHLITYFGPTLLMAMVVAVPVWLVSAALIFRLRETAPEQEELRSLQAAGLVALSAGFFPTIGAALAIFSLLFRFTPEGGEITSWAIAQAIKLLPILAIFCLPLVVDLRGPRLFYGRTAGFAFAGRLWMELLRPTWVAQAAFILVGWNWILNESIISSVFQSDLPAFSELVLRATSGRSAAYGIAAALIILQAALFGALCLVWGEGNFRAWQRRHAFHRI